MTYCVDTYCVDTSSLIAAWNERYPLKNVPLFWSHLSALIAEGRLVSPREVREEVTKKEDGLGRWLKAQNGLFVDLEEDIQLAVREILLEFPFLTKEISGRTKADPFVIALARARGLTVVTEEGPGNERRPRIPLVCQHYGVPCINILGVIQGEDWVL